MPYSFKRLTPSSLILVIVILSLIASQAYSFHYMAKFGPAVVATIDIEAVIANPSIKPKINAQLSDMAAKLDAEIGAKKKAADDLKGTIDLYPKGSDQYREAQDKLMRAVFEYQAAVEAGKIKQDAQRSKVLRDLYLNIKDAAATLATRNNYDIVLVNDSIADFPEGTEEEVTKQIGARRILYSTSTIDVTADLVQILVSQ
ncbi:MAG TPA: OmpH family outer membrane protein [Phycisphaerales bacterium]|nr:OmpH family outer membrane protein [Phycisphaerales bacterium]